METTHPEELAQQLWRWAQNELGYKRVVNLSSTSEKTEFGEAELQPLCRNQWIPIFQHLLNHVSSRRKVQHVRNVLASHQGVEHGLQEHSGSSKSLALKQLLASRLGEEETLKGRNQEKRERCRKSITRLKDIEAKIRQAQFRMKQKRIQLSLKEHYITHLKRFQKISENYLNMIQQIVDREKHLEPKNHLDGIREICVGMSEMTREIIRKGESSNLEEVNQRLETLVDGTPPVEFLRYIMGAIKESYTELKQLGPAWVTELENTDIPNLDSMLERCHSEQMARFVEIEEMLNAIEDQKRSIGQKFTELDADIANTFTEDIGSLVSDLVKAKAEYQSAIVAQNAIQDALQTARDDEGRFLEGSSDLEEQRREIQAVGREIDLKCLVLQTLARNNLRYRVNTVEQLQQFSGFSQEQIEPMKERFNGTVSRLKNFSINDCATYGNVSLSTEGTSTDGRSMNLTIHRINQDPFILKLKDILGCPSYMGAETFLSYLSTQMQDVWRMRTVKRHFATHNENFKSLWDYELEKLGSVEF
ncbi:hypothetical protein K493DRAFT_74402 [Basidiobolus meristosporus CBS 931.73]|uniref:Uncharacterized protein n=1 Tax=Basidiobolus meristosporus CBS 931.73 TaxID=1314790 RepID=A0A1Y1XSY0_9FUNG|nr:hypothetical protein K493DRAFT_74402 [Basidiobolus meristosporus CBS 931.73]|eukprot:ORX88795.1 hypothetical protein K493DRAFT_74402 [Basidiobolus meristosporus CBS 931.73]